MRILLIGPHGQVGRELSALLPDLGDVIEAGRDRADLADAQAVRDLVRGVAPDLIVNAAAYTAVDRAEEEPEQAGLVNGRAPGVIGEEAARLGAAVVHFSTDYVFDGTKNTAYTPDDEPRPLNVYGRTKLEGERALAASGAAHLILRTSWVYGPYGSNFVLTVLRLARRHGALSIVEDQRGCPSSSRRLAARTTEIIGAALVREGSASTFGAHGGVHHLASSDDASWHELAVHTLAAAEFDPMPAVHAIRSDQYPTVARRPKQSVLDCTSTRAAFGVDLGPWRPAVEEAVRIAEGEHRMSA